MTEQCAPSPIRDHLSGAVLTTAKFSAGTRRVRSAKASLYRLIWGFTGRLMGVLSGHGGPVRSLLAVGLHLWSGSDDRSICVCRSEGYIVMVGWFIELFDYGTVSTTVV